jgi:hypothetical protein
VQPLTDDLDDAKRTILDALAAANYANRSAHISILEGEDDMDRGITVMREANHMAIALLNEL